MQHRTQREEYESETKLRCRVERSSSKLLLITPSLPKTNTSDAKGSSGARKNAVTAAGILNTLASF